MAKFERAKRENFFLPEGGVVGGDSEFGGKDGNLFAKLYLENTRRNMQFIRLFTDSWYDYKGLQQLIAELLYIKKEWEEHPVFLEHHADEAMPVLEEDEEEEEPVEEEQEEPMRDIVFDRILDAHHMGVQWHRHDVFGDFHNEHEE